MTDHQQTVEEPSNMPLDPSTFTSSSSFPPERPPLNTPLASTTSSSRRSFCVCRSNRGQEEHFVTLHAVIISLITAIGGFVLFKFQSKGLSLFDEHGNIMRAAFVMLFVYVMAFMIEFRLQNQSNYFATMKQFTPLFGLIVVVLLLFVLSVFLGLAASIIWAFLVVGPIVRLFQQIIQSLSGIISFFAHYHCTNQTATRNPDAEDNDPLEIL